VRSSIGESEPLIARLIAPHHVGAYFDRRIELPLRIVNAGFQIFIFFLFLNKCRHDVVPHQRKWTNYEILLDG
jgi:hypothetical protein